MGTHKKRLCEAFLISIKNVCCVLLLLFIFFFAEISKIHFGLKDGLSRDIAKKGVFYIDMLTSW